MAKLNVTVTGLNLSIEGEPKQVAILAKALMRIQQGGKVENYSFSAADGEKEGLKVSQKDSHESTFKTPQSDEDTVVINLESMKEVGDE